MKLDLPTYPPKNLTSYMNAPQGMIYFIISNLDPIGIPQGFRSSLLFSNWEEKFAGNPIPQPVINKVL